jgi:tight adherence protein B
MGELVGLVLGIGLLLIAQALWFPHVMNNQSAAREISPTRTASRLTPQIAMAMLASGAIGAVVMLVVTTSLVVASMFGLLAGLSPLTILSRRRNRLRTARAGSWPDAVDDLASAVRAGMALPEALSALAQRGPVELREPFQNFAVEYARTGSFSRCLDGLAAQLDDPTGDRVVDALRLARDVGGTDLGRLLRTLSTVLREDARARAELVARQSWSMNAARVAVAAPWVTLIMLSFRPGALACYDSAPGAMVLAIAAGMSGIAYVLMRRIGRLPAEQRSRVS